MERVLDEISFAAPDRAWRDHQGRCRLRAEARRDLAKNAI